MHFSEPGDATKKASDAAASLTSYQLDLAKRIAINELKTTDQANIIAIAQIIATNYQTMTAK